MTREPLSVVIPAYNEEAVIGEVLQELWEALLEHEIAAEVIVVDDGSADGTAAAALERGARVLQHRSNRGYGAALKTGILAARHDVVAIMDADGTYPAAHLVRMLELLEHADMVVGARTGAMVHIQLARRPAKWALNCLANYVSGHRIEDLNSGLRVFRKDIVLQYFPILPDQFSWTTTITLALLCDNYAVRYLPIDYRERVGRSKIMPWDAGTFLALILRMAVLFRPLRVFLPLVALCLTYGTAKMVVDLAVTGDRNISATAVLGFVSALMILFMGMVADVIATRLGRLNPNLVASTRVPEGMELRREDADSLPQGPARRREA